MWGELGGMRWCSAWCLAWPGAAGRHRRPPMVEGRWARTATGQPDLDIQLRGQGTAYGYQGSVGGKTIEGSFETKSGLSSPNAVLARLGKLRAQKQPQKFSLEEYHPGVDPTRATTVEYTPATGDGGSKVQVAHGDVRLEVVLGEDGYPEVMVAPVRSSRLVLKRVDTVGSL
jgi:hypothetical protein